MSEEDKSASSGTKRPRTMSPEFDDAIAERFHATPYPNTPRLLVQKLEPWAFLPIRASAGAAGYDLASGSKEDIIVPARGKNIIPLNLKIKIPQSTYFRIAPRSGLAWKNFIDVAAGVVDFDYRGSVGVILFNHSDQDFIVKHGDRVAQGILEKIVIADVQEVEELDATDRGEGGFGSTGTSSLGITGGTPILKIVRTSPLGLTGTPSIAVGESCERGKP